jgi:NADH-quinone oxidoreductase subunit A
MLINIILQFITYCSLSILLSIVIYTIPYLLNHKVVINTAQLVAYECGFEPFNNAQVVMSINFFIVGILFLIFDLEIIYLIPYSKNLYYIGIEGFWSGFIFLSLLTLGFFYE